MRYLHIYIVAALFSLFALGASAQDKGKQTADDDRQKWITELRNFKHEFLIKELGLSKAEQEKFFPIYDEMDDQLTRISSETRDLEQKVMADDKASDTELSAAAAAVYQQKKREGEIEEQYYEKLKDVLSPRQLLSLKNAERKFTQQLIRRHRHIKANGKK